MKMKKSLSLGEKAYTQFRKEIMNHWKQNIMQSIAELALQLEPYEDDKINKRRVEVRIEEDTWEQLKIKAIIEGTTISRLIERALWERSEI